MLKGLAKPIEKDLDNTPTVRFFNMTHIKSLEQLRLFNDNAKNNRNQT
jgi:hypothetical protein